MKPGVPQPALFPTRISVNPAKPVEYNIGFKNPSVLKPASILALFNNAMIPANVGELAEVPPMRMGEPERKMRRKSPWAETSG